VQESGLDRSGRVGPGCKSSSSQRTKDRYEPARLDGPAHSFRFKGFVIVSVVFFDKLLYAFAPVAQDIVRKHIDADGREQPNIEEKGPGSLLASEERKHYGRGTRVSIEALIFSLMTIRTRWGRG